MDKTDKSLEEAVDNVLAFNKARKGKMDRPIGYINLGKPSSLYEMLGERANKITINYSVIEKAMGQRLNIRKFNHFKGNPHNLTEEDLKKITQQLEHPIAVFNTAKDNKNKGLIVLTELKEKEKSTGKEKAVAIILNRVKTKSGAEILNITSVYGRNENQWETALGNDLKYWDKEKGQQFLSAFQLQLPSHMHSNANLLNLSIKTNEDLVKYSQQKNIENSIPITNKEIAIERAEPGRHYTGEIISVDDTQTKQLIKRGKVIVHENLPNIDKSHIGQSVIVDYTGEKVTIAEKTSGLERAKETKMESKHQAEKSHVAGFELDE